MSLGDAAFPGGGHWKRRRGAGWRTRRGRVMRWRCQHRSRSGHASKARAARQLRRGHLPIPKRHLGSRQRFFLTNTLPTPRRYFHGCLTASPKIPDPSRSTSSGSIIDLPLNISANSPPPSSRRYPLTATQVRDGRPRRPAHCCSYRRPQRRHRMVRDREATSSRSRRAYSSVGTIFFASMASSLRSRLARRL